MLARAFSIAKRTLASRLVRSVSYRAPLLSSANTVCSPPDDEVPVHYNFISDYMEVVAAEEQANGKPRLAYWWTDSAGNELKYSYSELMEQSRIVANAMLNNGIHPGDRVLLMLPRVPEWWLLVLACIRSGIIPIPATIQISEHDVEFRLRSARPKAVFTIPELVGKIENASHHYSGPLSKIACEQLTSVAPIPKGWFRFSDMTKNARSQHECISNRTNDSMMSYFTSGTTGMPKMVDLPHGFALGHKCTTAKILSSGPDDIIWTYADPGWVATLYGSFFPPWYNLSTVFANYSPPAPPVWSELFEILKKYPITYFVTPPTVYRMLLHEKVPEKGELKHLRDCLSGGEPLNPETLSAWREKVGLDIRQVYGQTETPALIGDLKGSKIVPGSIGTAVGIDVQILNEKMLQVPVGEEGDLAVNLQKDRPYLVKQYIEEPEANEKAFRGDYYFTGDRATMDESGHFHFTSRSDDVIISSGYRIGPFEVESAIMLHPAVLETAIIGIPDEERGSIVKAFIVLKDGFKEVDKKKMAEDIQEAVKRETAPYKYPREIEFIEALPKTISNKIRRAELRKLEKERKQKKQ